MINDRNAPDLKKYDLASKKFNAFYAAFKSDERNKWMSELDSIYASIKSFNDDLLDKANEPYYIGANFYDAIDLAITGNALSLIKGMFQNNHYSITNALNLRNLIECFTLLSMDKRGDITDTQKMLFVEQYKLIEYETYAKGDSDKYSRLLNLSDLKARYESGKAKFLDIVGTESKLRRIINSRLPFLCDEKINYNILIEKYCPEFLQPYIYLSRIVHPSSYDLFREEKLYNTISVGVMKLVIERYRDKTPKPTELPYYKEEALIYGFGISDDDNYGQKLYDIQKEQWQILKKISKEFQRIYGENNYVKNFLNEVAMILHDVNTDSHLGYTENIKLKFKVIAEAFACFYRIYVLDVTAISYFYDMLNWHDIIKEKEQFGVEVDEEDKDIVYKRYLERYTTSKLTREEMLKEYDKQLGFLIDGDGKVPKLGQLVEDYLEKLCKDASISEKGIKIKDFYKIVYKESHNLSHGCGYMFFANIGAWMDDITVLQFLDNSIIYFLEYMGLIFAVYADECDANKFIAGLLKESLVGMEKLVKSKMEIFKKISRIKKKF